MAGAANDYEFVTRWEVEATPDEVFDILEDVTALPRWWPSVYLEVTEIERGAADGVGRVVSFFTKGWLPYTLRWSARLLSSQRPATIELEAFGDLEGRGLWTLEQSGSLTVVTYRWTVRAEKALLNTMSFALKPVFAANHEWAMARGLASLKLELLRRRAETAEQRARVADPPAPTPRSTTPLLIGAVGLLSALVGAASLWRRRPREF
ncbi:MAG: hypothetical protein JWM10_1554 [Myxococcaceae bacterium]|nr:hypothetical protein [Myxococcaceae bacterium]